MPTGSHSTLRQSPKGTQNAPTKAADIAGIVADRLDSTNWPRIRALVWLLAVKAAEPLSQSLSYFLLLAFQPVSVLGCYGCPMKYLLSHTSALEYWSHCDIPEGMPFPRSRLTFDDPLTKQVAKDLPIPGFIHFPIDVLVNDKGAMRTSDRVVSHRWERLPVGSCSKIAQTLYVSAPEACFLQLASSADLVELIKIGYELCGTYAVASDGADLADLRPRTSADKLRRYLDRVSGIAGVKMARRAASFVVDGSASPMETSIALLLTLPTSLGGFGFPRPSMNHEVQVKGRKYRCDLCWPAQRFALEYDSDTHHSSQYKLNVDSTRRTQLELSGFHVISISKMQVFQPILFRDVARVTAEHLGIRHQSTRVDFEARHTRLRWQVLESGRYRAERQDDAPS